MKDVNQFTSDQTLCPSCSRMSAALCPWIAGKSIKPYPGFDMEIKYKDQRYSDNRNIKVPFVKYCNHFHKGRLPQIGRIAADRDVTDNSYRCRINQKQRSVI